MIAGTASVVCSCTLVALRYHVAFRASAAKFGKRPASIRCRPSIRLVTGNSSKTTTTIGGSRRGAAIDSAFAVPSSFAIGERARNSAEEDQRHRCQHRQEHAGRRAFAHTRTAKAARQGRCQERPGPSSACARGPPASATTAASSCDQHEVYGRRRRGTRRAQRAPRCRRARPALRARERARRRRRQRRCEPRTTKNSGVFPSRSKSGCATANAAQHRRWRAFFASVRLIAASAR